MTSISFKSLSQFLHRGGQGDLGCCSTIFLMQGCGEQTPPLCCCSDLKPYSVRCFCFSHYGIPRNEIICSAEVSCLTLLKREFIHNLTSAAWCSVRTKMKLGKVETLNIQKIVEILEMKRLNVLLTA